MNRRSFVTGLASVYPLVILRGGPASGEHKAALGQRVRAQLDLGVSDGLTVGAVMMVRSARQGAGERSCRILEPRYKESNARRCNLRHSLDKRTYYGLWSPASGGRQKARTGRPIGEILA